MTIERPMFPPRSETCAVIVKFPFSVSPRAHSRKARASKNGTPEERAAKAVEAVAALSPAGSIAELPRAPRRTLLEHEFEAKLNQLDPLSRKYIEGYMQALIDGRPKQ